MNRIEGLQLLYKIITDSHHNKLVGDAKTSALVMKQGIIITKAAKQALQYMLERRYKMFDALVGETSCQLRAAKIISIGHEINASPKKQQLLRDNIVALESVTIDLISKLDQVQTPTIPVTSSHHLLGKINREKIQLRLNEDDLFLVLSHLLTLTRDAENKKKTNEMNLLHLLGPIQFIEQEYLIKTVWKAKEALANLSIAFIQKEAHNLLLCEGEKTLLKGMVGKRNLCIATNLSCCPCLSNIHIIMERIRQQNGMILLKIMHHHKANLHSEKIKLLLHCTDGETFHRVEDHAELSERAVMVFSGISCNTLTEQELIEQLMGKSDVIKHRLKSRIMQLVLANAAAHPQYSGKKRDYDIPLYSKKNEEGACITELLEYVDAKVRQTEEAATIEDAVKKYVGPTNREKNIYQNLCNPIPLFELVKSFLLYQELKVIAQTEGFCKQNNRLFQIKHIYVDTIEHACRKKA